MPRAVAKDESGAEYAARLAAALSRGDEDDELPPSDVDDEFDDEDSCFSTRTVDDRVSHDVYDRPAP
jgi:hypothetical protein